MSETLFVLTLNHMGARAPRYSPIARTSAQSLQSGDGQQVFKSLHDWSDFVTVARRLKLRCELFTLTVANFGEEVKSKSGRLSGLSRAS